jgi:uncharacterized protein (TIGR03435 family)
MGGFGGRNIPARTLINIAYGLRFYQIAGLPDWGHATGYDINARAPAGASREQVPLMLRSLLAERFNFAGHLETRLIDGFVLQRVRGDRLGSNLRSSALDCVTNFSSEARCREGGIGLNWYRQNGIPISQIVSALESSASAPIEDQTGLTGPFDIDLRWSNETAPTDDVPTIFTAIQEQLGLRLERRRIEKEVLVVDRIERPTPD